jgi:hypothetical protein
MFLMRCALVTRGSKVPPSTTAQQSANALMFRLIDFVRVWFLIFPIPLVGRQSLMPAQDGWPVAACHVEGASILSKQFE